MELGVELVAAGVDEDERPALPDERLAPVKVEEIPGPHDLHQQRVQDRVHVVGGDVGDAAEQDVALALDRDRVLLEGAGEGPVVDRLGAAGVAADQLERAGDGVEELAFGGGRQPVHAPAGGGRGR